MEPNNFRYCKKGHGNWSLSDHEVNELDTDFDIEVKNYYVIAALTKDEWEFVRRVRELVSDKAYLNSITIK